MTISKRTVVCLIHSSDPQLRAMYSGLSDVQKEGGQLILVAIADPRDGHSLGNRLSDRSFVGLKLATEVERLTTQHEEDRLQEQLKHAQKEAHKAGISADVVFEEGEVATTFQKIVQRIHPTRTHVPRLPQSLGDRLLRGDSTDSLIRSLNTPVIIAE